MNVKHTQQAGVIPFINSQIQVYFLLTSQIPYLAHYEVHISHSFSFTALPKVCVNLGQYHVQSLHWTLPTNDSTPQRVNVQRVSTQNLPQVSYQAARGMDRKESDVIGFKRL